MAKEDGLLPVVSIFINPIQFNQSADFAAYPIRTETDIALLEAAGCKALFMPSTAEMYAESVQLRFDFGHLDTVLEGSGRPGHFSGVGVVVSRLFHQRNFKPELYLWVCWCLCRRVSFEF
jgi:pantoate--beta-alanine ligase